MVGLGFLWFRFPLHVIPQNKMEWPSSLEKWMFPLIFVWYLLKRSVQKQGNNQFIEAYRHAVWLYQSYVGKEEGQTRMEWVIVSPQQWDFLKAIVGQKKKKVWINLMNKCHAVIFSEPCKYILKTWDIKKEINIIALWPGWDQFILLLLLIFFDIYFFYFKISSSMEVRIKNLDNPAADCFTVGFQKSLRMPRFYCCQWMCRVFSFQLCCLHIQSHLLLLKSRLAPRRDTQNVGYSEYSSWITVAFKKLLCEVKANMLHLQSPTNTC